MASLAFHHLVALLDQALAFAIFALGLLLDVRAFFIGHDDLQGEVRASIRFVDSTSRGWAACQARFDERRQS